MTAWLLAWLWQGTALAVSVSLLLRFLPRVNASTRCFVWWIGFAALIWLGWQASPNTPAGAAAAMAAPSTMRGQLGAIEVSGLPEWTLALVLFTWVTVALFRLLRILPGVHFLYRLKDECRPFPRRVEEQLPLWREARGRRVRLMLCDQIPGAAVLGLHDPYIAVPSSLLKRLSATDLDQVILHEHGHVQRRDDWMRLLQALLEAALWPHPAAFLIGRALNLEREVACDDRVVARTGAPRDYAGCLARVAEVRRRGTAPTFAPAMFGGHSDLIRRVDRLLDSRRNARPRPSAMTVAVGICLIAMYAGNLRAFPLFVETMEQTILPSFVTHVIVSASLPPANTHPAAPTSRPAAIASVRAQKVKTADWPAPDAASPALSEATVARSNEPASTTDAELPEVLNGRSFQPTYQAADSFNRDISKDHVSPWRVFGNAGAAVGASTRKAGTGIAGALTRAGVSIGRSF